MADAMPVESDAQMLASSSTGRAVATRDTQLCCHFGSIREQVQLASIWAALSGHRFGGQYRAVRANTCTLLVAPGEPLNHDAGSDCRFCKNSI